MEHSLPELAAPQRGRVGDGGLARQMVRRTFPIVAAVVLVTQAALGLTSYLEQYGALRARAALIARLTAEAIARPLWNLDVPVYESQIKALASDRAFVRAEVVDVGGTVLFRQQAVAPSWAGTIAVSVPVMEPNSAPPAPLARLDLVLSTAELAGAVTRQAVIGLAAFAVLLISFSATVHVILKRLVLQPLHILLRAMGRVERKDWQHAGWSSPDEIGRVVDAFNRMVEGLRSGDEARRLLADLSAAQAQLTENNRQLARANQLVLDSINYARRIQAALLPDLAVLDGQVAEVAAIWRPRDIVGGDYYWAGTIGGKVLLVLVDCTGHGVPGAFMTMIAAAVLDRVLHHHSHDDPAEMLLAIDRLVRALLRQDRSDGGSDDGLDAAICVFDSAEARLTYAGARIPLLIGSPAGVDLLRGDRYSLGYRAPTRRARFRNHIVTVRPGTTVYLASDGVTDQLSPDRRLFGRRRLIESLRRTTGRPLDEQLASLTEALDAFRAGEACPDDVSLLACRLA